mmetsp:Transcript_29005/g.85733  ORF Transcript_29005/g.85733 Transcript_29005/m.85733 type:complete len:219 (+) Transcript_29005:874-1530(+)
MERRARHARKRRGLCDGHALWHCEELVAGHQDALRVRAEEGDAHHGVPILHARAGAHPLHHARKVEARADGVAHILDRALVQTPANRHVRVIHGEGLDAHDRVARGRPVGQARQRVTRGKALDGGRGDIVAHGDDALHWQRLEHEALEATRREHEHGTVGALSPKAERRHTNAQEDEQPADHVGRDCLKLVVHDDRVLARQRDAQVVEARDEARHSRR